MKKPCINLLVIAFTCCISLFFSCCRKDPYDIEKRKKSVLENYLHNIGPLPLSPIQELETVELSRTGTQQVLVVPPYIDNAETYKRDLLEEKTTALTPRLNNVASIIDNNVWPGNLIQGASLSNPILSAVPLGKYRKPGTVYLNVVSGQQMEYSRHITDFTGSEVTQAMNDIMGEHENGLPAHVNYYQQIVHSQSDMAYWLDMSESEFQTISGNTFSSVDWNDYTKTFLMVKLEQVYFTMAFDNQSLDDIFTDDVPLSEIQKYTGKGNPLCYISSVCYGRYFILLYEADTRILDITNLIDKIFNSENKDNPTANEYSIMGYPYAMKFRMVQVGGNAEEGLAFLTNPTYDNFRNFILHGSRFDKDHVGAPIYYNLTYAHNGQSVTTYKSLDTTYKRYEYSIADNDNEVEITIQKISSSKLELSGGNWRLNNKSNFSVGNINISILNSAGNWDVIKTIPTGINGVNSSDYATNRSYYQKVNFGKLGHDTDKRIRISFSASYNNVRGSKSGKVKDSQTRYYDEAVYFEYDSEIKKWKQYHSQKSAGGNNVDFREINISDRFNYCNVNLKMSYEFKANYRIY